MKKFSPQPYQNNPITIRIPEEKLQKIDTLAAQHGMSRSELINQCIDYALEHLDEEQK